MEISSLEIIRSKIKGKEELSRLLSYWRFKDQKIVFTNGCFDILHQGHIDYLSKAKDLGNVLIIGLNTDHSVKQLKGEGRPLQDEHSRAMILASLFFVDAVVLFNENTPYELIQFISPDVLVKGGDYQPEEIAGYDIVKNKDGEVVTLPFLEGFSTTGIINKSTDQ